MVFQNILYNTHTICISFMSKRKRHFICINLTHIAIAINNRAINFNDFPFLRLVVNKNHRKWIVVTTENTGTTRFVLAWNANSKEVVLIPLHKRQIAPTTWNNFIPMFRLDSSRRYRGTRYVIDDFVGETYRRRGESQPETVEQTKLCAPKSIRFLRAE